MPRNRVLRMGRVLLLSGDVLPADLEGRLTVLSIGAPLVLQPARGKGRQLAMSIEGSLGIRECQQGGRIGARVGMPDGGLCRRIEMRPCRHAMSRKHARDPRAVAYS